MVKATVHYLHTAPTNVPREKMEKRAHRTGIKVRYAANSLVASGQEAERSTVSNSSRSDYTDIRSKRTRVVLEHYRTDNFQPLSEAGGNTTMSDQLDRQQIQDMIEKSIQSQNEKIDLKLEILSNKLEAGLQSVEANLSQKIDSMNSALSQTLLEIKSENALIKKDIELQSVDTQALVTKSFNDAKDLINKEKEIARAERKSDRKYLITTAIATCGIVLTLLVRLFI